MKVNIGNREFKILDTLFYLLKDQKHETLIAEAFFSNDFDINNPIQYCVINFILKPIEKR